MPLEHFLQRMIAESNAQHWTAAYEACRAGLLLSGKFRGWTDDDIMRAVRKAFPDANGGRRRLPDLLADLPSDAPQGENDSHPALERESEKENQRTILLLEAMDAVRTAMKNVVGTSFDEADDTQILVNAGVEALAAFMNRLEQETPDLIREHGEAISHVATHLQETARILLVERIHCDDETPTLRRISLGPSTPTPMPQNLTPLAEGQMEDGMRSFLQKHILSYENLPPPSAELINVQCLLPLTQLWRSWCQSDASRAYSIDHDRMRVLFNRVVLHIGYEVQWDTEANDFMVKIPQEKPE